MAIEGSGGCGRQRKRAGADCREGSVDTGKVEVRGSSLSCEARRKRSSGKAKM